MDTVNMVLCGLGGQGILFLTRLIALAALEKGLNVMGAETHGMAQRGGSVVSHLRIGEVESSLVRTGSADFVLALEENEAYRNLPFLRKGAGLYVNADGGKFPRQEVRGFLEKRDIRSHAMAAGEMALELGAPRSTNLALLGYFSGFSEGPVSRDDLRAAVESASPDRFRELNLTVFDAGFQAAEGRH